MKTRTTTLAAALLAAAALGGPAAATAGAQAWNYPSFQQPRTIDREYNFAVADGGGHTGTSFVFQWREGTTLGNQLSLDVGLADPDFTGTKLLVGGQFAHQLGVSSAQVPFDLLFTAGVNGALGGGSLLRIPVGVSVGRRFPLEGGLAITPYVHPRLAIDVCSSCGDRDRSSVGLDFDLGADFQFSPQFSLRFSALFSGSDYFFANSGDAFGLSLAWRPPGLVRR
jgi:hypothetical protein